MAKQEAAHGPRFVEFPAPQIDDCYFTGPGPSLTVIIDGHGLKIEFTPDTAFELAQDFLLRLVAAGAPATGAAAELAALRPAGRA